MTTRSHLQLVDEKYTKGSRVYAVILDLNDFADDVNTLDQADFIVINGDEDRCVNEVDMRVHLQGMSVADALVLPDTWWTSAEAHILVTIASWVGIKFISADGVSIDTTSSRAK